MTKFLIKKKDTVKVLAGRDKGKKGEVLRVFPDDGRVLVAKVNVVMKHHKPTQTEPGGRREQEAPLALSKVMLVCPKCEQAVRPKRDTLKTGERVRVCRKCSEIIL
ncbi:MAG: 50S ribosomal protein L24 [Elusimicrobia bacterium]|nr:50S ribosomal protein L24 [Elusimicrobiota bacterium]MBI5594971.1 50S ribosomal protein L24 [Elusimicrobiota bacterium]